MPVRIKVPLFSWRWRSPDGAAFLLTLLVFGYGVSRTGSEYRWSSWAYGDAQMLNAAEHFKEEGFLAHHFLPAVNPGPSHSLIPNNAPNGRYTHYPALHALIAGVLTRYSASSARLSRIAAIAAFAISLLITYLALRALFGPQVALPSVFFIATSRLWLDFMDALCGQPYDELFRAMVLALSIQLHQKANARPEKFPWLTAGALWVFLFLQAFNSIEYFISLQILVLGFLCLSSFARPTKLALAALFLSAPALSLSLHFLQTAIEWQGVSGALADWSAVAGNRILEPFAKAPLLPLRRYFQLTLLPWAQRGFGGVRFLFPLGLIFLLPENAAALGLLAASSLAFYFLFPQQAFQMSYYSPMHVLPLLALVISGAIVRFHASLVRFCPSPLARSLLFASFTIGTIGLLPLNQLTSYLKAFPNPLWQDRKWAYSDRGEAEWKKQIARAKAVRSATNAGDLIFVPPDAQATSAMEASPVEEYFAQRHLVPLGEQLSVFRKRLDLVLRDPHPRNGRVLFLVDSREVHPEIRGYLEQNYSRLREVPCGKNTCSLFGPPALTRSANEKRTLADTLATRAEW